jgi:hypothetical protein
VTRARQNGSRRLQRLLLEINQQDASCHTYTAAGSPQPMRET